MDAAVAEMLISGLELTLGTVAAHALLGRKVSRSRWAGVAIVAVGVMIVERANRGRHVRTDEDADGPIYPANWDWGFGVFDTGPTSWSSYDIGDVDEIAG